MLEFMLLRDGISQAQIDAMMKVDQPAFESTLEDMEDEYEYDADVAIEDPVHDDNDDRDENDEKYDPIRDDMEGDKSSRIASPGGSTSTGHQNDRPADSQMATGTQ